MFNVTQGKEIEIISSSKINATDLSMKQDNDMNNTEESHIAPSTVNRIDKAPLFDQDELNDLYEIGYNTKDMLSGRLNNKSIPDGIHNDQNSLEMSNYTQTRKDGQDDDDQNFDEMKQETPLRKVNDFFKQIKFD